MYYIYQINRRGFDYNHPQPYPQLPPPINLQEEFTRLKLGYSDIVLPKDCNISFAPFLKSLLDTDLVTILSASRTGLHGLQGKVGNRCNLKVQQAFIDFVLGNRSPTGRTLQADGRYHGAQFFLHSRFSQIRLQQDKKRKKVKDIVAKQTVLQCAFEEAMEKDPALQIHETSGSSVRAYMAQFFSINGKFGHTVLHPHSTDVCATCCSFKTDLNSSEAKLKRYQGHKEDAGSIEQIAVIKELKVEIQALNDALREHRHQAGQAQDRFGLIHIHTVYIGIPMRSNTHEYQLSYLCIS